MADQWHVRREKQRFGPYTAAQLRQMASDGRLMRTDMICKEGSQKWVPASAVKGLFGATKPVPPPLPVTEQDDEPEPVPGKANRRRHPGLPIWIWAGGGVGGLGLLVACVLLVVFVGGKPTNPGPGDGVAKGSKGGEVTEVKGNTNRPLRSEPPVDFSGVDYTADFSSFDYSVDPSSVVTKKHGNGQLAQQGGFKNGKKHGKWLMWYESGQKESEEQFFEGEQHGPCVMWHKNGRDGAKMVYLHGKQHGRVAVWFDDGEPDTEGWYLHGVEHGLFRRWSQSSGRKQEEVAFVKGLAQGTYTAWYSDGKKAMEGAYHDGWEVGVWTSWYGDGAVYSRTESHFTNGVIRWTTTLYWPSPDSGKKMKVKLWDDGGRLVSETSYNTQDQAHQRITWDQSGVPQVKRFPEHLPGKPGTILTWPDLELRIEIAAKQAEMKKAPRK